MHIYPLLLTLPDKPSRGRPEPNEADVKTEPTVPGDSRLQKSKKRTTLSLLLFYSCLFYRHRSLLWIYNSNQLNTKHKQSLSCPQQLFPQESTAQPSPSSFQVPNRHSTSPPIPSTLSSLQSQESEVWSSKDRLEKLWLLLGRSERW